MTEAKPIKIILLGEAFVGKTSIINHYLREKISNEYTPTIVVFINYKKVLINGIEFSLSISDTAGQERYRSLVPHFWRNVQVAVIVFDVTNPKSFYKMKDWIDHIRNYDSDRVTIHICANKCDLNDQRIIEYKRGEEFAHQNGIKYSEASAKTGYGINQMFENVLNIYFDQNAKQIICKTIILISEILKEKIHQNAVNN
jgi:Rab family protein